MTEGPLVSYQSLALGLIGSGLILLLASSVAKKINLVDIGDELRRDHSGKIPLVGGIGLFVSLIYGSIVFGVDHFYLYLLGSLLPIVVVGVLDGIQGVTLNLVYRIIAQIISSWIIIALTDVYVRDLGDLFGFGNLYIGQLGIPFTIFCVVGVTNAFNMIDGKDGLLGSVSSIIMTSLLILFYINGMVYLWAFIVVISILIFLGFNLSLFGKKRKIFLGDHGSCGLGYLTAWTLIYLSQETTYVTPISAVWFILLPLTDALLTFVRRLKSSRSVFEADRLHFHHLLSDNGLPNSLILFLCSLVTIIACSIAIASNIYDLNEYYLFFGYITLLVIFALQGLSTPRQSK